MSSPYRDDESIYGDRIESIVLRQSRPVAAKSHTCFECGREIPRGIRYIRRVMLIDGEFESLASHSYYGECQLQEEELGDE